MNHIGKNRRTYLVAMTAIILLLFAVLGLISLLGFGFSLTTMFKFVSIIFLGGAILRLLLYAVDSIDRDGHDVPPMKH